MSTRQGGGARDLADRAKELAQRADLDQNVSASALVGNAHGSRARLEDALRTLQEEPGDEPSQRAVLIVLRALELCERA